MLKVLCCRVPQSGISHGIHTSAAVLKSFYDVLGITPKATQSEIKNAYYKLSMQYHPDKNKSSTAESRFREITEAYEILGNYKTRNRYDRGMINSSFSAQGSAAGDSDFAEEKYDDAQTRFYKRHMKRDRPPPPTGSTPIYDFDEWSRAHYGKVFDRKRMAKQRYDKIKNDNPSIRSQHIELTVLGIVISLCAVIIFVNLDQRGYDTVEKSRSADGESRG